MIVVSDTTPLISLMKIQCLDVLEPLFGQVLIPDAVFSELTTNPSFQDEASAIRHCDFIRRVSVRERMAVDVLRAVSGLDIGESEAIVFAEDVHADVVLMDEAKGRKAAKSKGLFIMGTVGVLLFAFEEHLLSAEEVKRAVDALRFSRRHISQSLLEEALRYVDREKDD